MSGFYESCKEVKRELDASSEVRKKFGGSKKFIVPKTMAIGNQFDNFQRLAMVTSLEYEKYSQDEVALALDYANTDGITHTGIDLEKKVRRRAGECSVVLELDVLKKVYYIVFSQDLMKVLQKSNSVVAWALGSQIFMCASGQKFLASYRNILKDAGVTSNLGESY